MHQSRILLLFVFVGVVVALTVYLLKTLTALTGGGVFPVTALIAILSFVLYAYVVTKVGY